MKKNLGNKLNTIKQYRQELRDFINKLLNDEIKCRITENDDDFKEKYFPKLILLQNHGIICCGETIQECIMSTDICEKSAEIFIGSHVLGKTHFLNETEVNNLITDKKEIYRQNLIKQNGNK